MDMVTYLMAKKHGGGMASMPWGCESVTEAPLDIQWDGTLDGKELIEFEPGSGWAYIKLSDAVLTEEQVKACFITATGTFGGETQTISANGTDEGAVQDMGGGIAFADMLALIVYDPSANAEISATGMTPGIYTIYYPTDFAFSEWHLWSDTVTIKTETMVPFPNKYMTFLDVTAAAETILEETTVTAEHKEQDDGEGGKVVTDGCALPVLLTPGKTYRVVYDGTEHIVADLLTELVAENELYGQVYNSYWGTDLNSILTPTAGNPYFVNWKGDLSGVGHISTTTTMFHCHEDDVGEHTIAIYTTGAAEETVTLKEECLPKNLWYGKIGQEQYEGDVLLESTVSSGSIGAGQSFDNDEKCVALGKLKEGDRVIVTWNGEKFEHTVRRCTLTMVSDWAAFNGTFSHLGVGNFGGYLLGVDADMSDVTVITDEVDTGEDYVVLFETTSPEETVTQMTVFIAKESANDVDHTVSIYAERYVNKLPEAFIPELSEIILCSSTEGSTKKFKVTIDDNGQLTPTEITS